MRRVVPVRSVGRTKAFGVSKMYDSQKIYYGTISVSSTIINQQNGSHFALIKPL
jgi:hypothetical protein